MKSYQELVVWQKSFQLTKLVYLFTKSFPNSEQFGLVGQMRRASVSIPSNIAEGFGRRTTGEFIQFIRNALGSACELETQLLLAFELKFIKPAYFQEANELLIEVIKMLNSLHISLKNKKR
jgi:four helix bundle protein